MIAERLSPEQRAHLARELRSIATALEGDEVTSGTCSRRAFQRPIRSSSFGCTAYETIGQRIEATFWLAQRTFVKLEVQVAAQGDG